MKSYDAVTVITFVSNTEASSSSEAMMTALPAATPVTTPPSTVAISSSFDDHTTSAVEGTVLAARVIVEPQQHWNHPIF